MWHVVDVFTTGLWGNGCEQVLKSHFNAEAELPEACAAGNVFLERSDNVTGVVQSVFVTFRRFVYLISNPLKHSFYTTFVCWWINLRQCERLCVWMNIYFLKYEKKEYFQSIMMMIAFITFKSSLVPLFEGLWCLNSWEFELLGFRRNRTDDLEIDSPLLWPTEPRLHVRYDWCCFY